MGIAFTSDIRLGHKACSTLLGYGVLPCLLLGAILPVYAGVDVRNGAFYYQADVIPQSSKAQSEPGRLWLNYNSANEHVGIFGTGWCAPFERHLQKNPEGTLTLISCGGFQTSEFIPTPSESAYSQPAWINRQRQECIVFEEGRFVHYFGYEVLEKYDQTGNLINLAVPGHEFMSIKTQEGHVVELEVGNTKVSLRYRKDGRIGEIVSGKRRFEYRYTPEGHLADVISQSRSLAHYRYSAGRLASIRGAVGARQDVTYGEDGRVVLWQEEGKFCQSVFSYSRGSGIESVNGNYYGSLKIDVATAPLTKAPVSYSDADEVQVEVGSMCLLTRKHYYIDFPRPGEGKVVEQKLEQGRYSTRTMHYMHGMPVRLILDHDEQDKWKDRRYDYEYDSHGRILRRIQFNSSEPLQNAAPSIELLYVYPDKISVLPETVGALFRDAKGAIERMQWKKLVLDSAGRATHIFRSDGKSIIFTYDGRGQIVSETDARGNTVKLSYGGLWAKPNRIDIPKIGSLEVRYSADGNIDSVKEIGNRSGRETLLSFVQLNKDADDLLNKGNIDLYQQLPEFRENDPLGNIGGVLQETTAVRPNWFLGIYELTTYLDPSPF